MSERALAETYEVRHYALGHAGAACGALFGTCTTAREHVNCSWCQKAMLTGGFGFPEPRPTLGEQAIRELAELREGVKRLAEQYAEEYEVCGEPAYGEAAHDLRDLLDGPTNDIK